MNRFFTVIILISIFKSCNYKNQPEPNLQIPKGISIRYKPGIETILTSFFGHSRPMR